MEQIDQIKRQIIDTGRRLVTDGLVSRTWGNVSNRIDGEHMAITPTGRAYEGLTLDDIVLVNYHTSKYKGTIQPSSEYRLHAEIYKTRKEINAIIHTHQLNVSTVAAARREVPPILDDMVQLIGPSVRVAEYALPSTKKIVRKTMKALRGRMAALMANHGAICLGRTMDEAFVICEVLEKACKAFIEAEFLGGAKSIGKFDAWIMHQYFLKKYSSLDRKNK